MVYIDQPVGVGSSYGAPCCNSTETASIPVWNLIQAFNGEFPEYGSRQFGIFGESYGGRYLRLFADEVLDKNNGIANGTVNGTHVNLTTLGINDGTHDAKIWYRALIDYAHDKPYRQLTNDSMVEEYIANYQETCLPLLDVRSSAIVLPGVIDAGVNNLLWTGDADVICSWVANSRGADSIAWSKHAEFNSTSLGSYTVNGTEKGQFKNADNFSYMRVYVAGHMIMYYGTYQPEHEIGAWFLSREVPKKLMDSIEPEAWLQVFKQMLIYGKPSST
ncbi:putative Carboxypeptidase [Seiridium cardinale]